MIEFGIGIESSNLDMSVAILGASEVSMGRGLDGTDRGDLMASWAGELVLVEGMLLWMWMVQDLVNW